MATAVEEQSASAADSAVSAQQPQLTDPVAGAGAGSGEQPGFIARGRARRRARFLRKARELAYRDLGGLVFNLHRFGQRNDPLVLAKLTTLGHIDSELRALEDTLEERQPITVLSEAGITACARCAAIHSSEDRFCPNCGLPLHRHATLPADLGAVTGGAGVPGAGPAMSPAVSPAAGGVAAGAGASTARATPVAATPVPPAPDGGAPGPSTATYQVPPSAPAGDAGATLDMTALQREDDVRTTPDQAPETPGESPVEGAGAEDAAGSAKTPGRSPEPPAKRAKAPARAPKTQAAAAKTRAKGAATPQGEEPAPGGEPDDEATAIVRPPVKRP